MVPSGVLLRDREIPGFCGGLLTGEGHAFFQARDDFLVIKQDPQVIKILLPYSKPTL